jgi:hypothetical protein
MTIQTNDLPSLASAAMLGSLNISVWEARKKDKGIEQEVQVSKGARSKRATSVHKHLFAESPALEAIKTLRGEIRVWFNRQTLPWDDNSNRIITTAQYFEISHDFANYKRRFDDLVNIFVTMYPTEISKQAFEMGSMFNRNEYPDVSDVKRRFECSLNLTPLPMAGDFRVDIGTEALKELQDRCEADTQMRLSVAMADAWGRVKEQVEWVRDRMDAVLGHNPDDVEEIPTYDDAGTVIKVDIKKKRRPKLHESMLDQGIELCSLMRDLNITNDPKLEEARKMLESALVRVDMDSLKESTEVQTATRNAMNNILSKFNF